MRHFSKFLLHFTQLIFISGCPFPMELTFSWAKKSSTTNLISVQIPISFLVAGFKEGSPLLVVDTAKSLVESSFSWVRMQQFVNISSLSAAIEVIHQQVVDSSNCRRRHNLQKQINLSGIEKRNYYLGDIVLVTKQ